MHYEGLIHSMTNDSKPKKMNFNLSQILNYKLSWVILLIQKASFWKESFFVGEVDSGTHFSFSSINLNFKCQKLKQYDWIVG